jgi:hypothetical protein
MSNANAGTASAGHTFWLRRNRFVGSQVALSLEGPAGDRRVQVGSKVEATSGFEPLNRGFADLRVKPLHHVASGSQPGDCAIGVRGEPVAEWLPLEDSNLAQRIQSPLSYH